MAKSGRCDCYAGHNSSIGRCNTRNVDDPAVRDGLPVFCARCKTECRKGKAPTVEIVPGFTITEV